MNSSQYPKDLRDALSAPVTGMVALYFDGFYGSLHAPGTVPRPSAAWDGIPVSIRPAELWHVILGCPQHQT